MDEDDRWNSVDAGRPPAGDAPREANGPAAAPTAASGGEGERHDERYGERHGERHDERGRGGDAPSFGPPVLEVEGLVKRYGRVEALSGLDLSVREGEVYGFLGRNGAGKSTTIRILMGITRPSGGAVRLFGEALGRDPTRLRQRVGYVAQEQNFYGWMSPLTLGRFVGGFFPTWDQDAYRRLLRTLELPPDRKVRTFSGGMRVKVALALALAHHPRLLVLDEPTAGLDPVARREFLEMVREQAEEEGRTTFFSTHLVDEIELAAHRVGIVDGGRTVYQGRLSDLTARVRLLRQAADAPGAAALPPALATAVDQAAVGGQRGGEPLRVLQDRVLRGERQVVVHADAAERLAGLGEGGWRVEELSLEEAFIAMVRRPIAV